MIKFFKVLILLKNSPVRMLFLFDEIYGSFCKTTKAGK